MYEHENDDINYLIVTSDYDNQKVKRDLKDYLDREDGFCIDLVKRIPNLIIDYKDHLVVSNKNFIADVIIVDDEFQSILQYFKTLQRFSRLEKIPIKNIVACTKCLPALTIFNLIYKNATASNDGLQYPDPKVIFIDYDLRDTSNLCGKNPILTVAREIFEIWGGNVSPVLVSAFYRKEEDGFTEVEDYLRKKGYDYILSKNRNLWDQELMNDNYHIYFSQKKHDHIETNIDSNEKALEELEKQYTVRVLQSATVLLDEIENAIRRLEEENKVVTLDSLQVINKKGKVYTSGSLEMEVSKKNDVIVSLLMQSSAIQKYLNRWSRTIVYIRNGTLFPRKIGAFFKKST